MEHITPRHLDNSQYEKNEISLDVLEKQELYRKINAEISNIVIIEGKDTNSEGQLLSPNGEVSNLPEHEWKMARTSSFLRKFGDWKTKYDKEHYDLWLSYQKMQKMKDNITKISKRIEFYKERNREEIAHTGQGGSGIGIIKSLEQQRIELSHQVSVIHAELGNKGFNIHSSDLDYTKILDENGEPLLLYRGTDYRPDDEGRFIAPKVQRDNIDYQVGVFLGVESEARHHHEARKKEGGNSNLYTCFVNGRNIKIIDNKINYWAEPEEIKNIQEKYDGLWVNNYNQGNNETYNEQGDINLMDYVCFNPEDILITGVE